MSMNRRIAGFVILIFLPYAALAQTSVWNGGTGNWSNGALWTGGIPGSGSTVLIDNGKPVNSAVTLDTSATIRNLTIDSGDSLQQSDALTLSVGNGGPAATVLVNGTL